MNKQWDGIPIVC